MIVVSDTTPLNYLVLIDAVEVLPKLFHDIYTPETVLQELTNSRASETVRRWAGSPPSWLRTMTPATRLPSTARLDPGEADAISLAIQIQAPVVLLDEAKGRRVAMDEGLVVIRTLALLEVAAERQLIDLPQTLQRLQATTFRVQSSLIEAAIARDTDRKTRRP